jgi:hypothetical protein
MLDRIMTTPNSMAPMPISTTRPLYCTAVVAAPITAAHDAPTDLEKQETRTQTGFGPCRSLATSQSAPEGIRTPNLLIRSQMLYPLSYERNC